MSKGDKRVNKTRGTKIGGARIRVSFIVVVMAAVAIAFGYVREILSYSAAVILHEFAHATVAARLGYTLNTLKIMPYGAALTGEFEGARPRHEILIALAGPLSNVLFAVLFIAVWWLVPSLFYYTEIYVTANIFTAAVNFLPVFPLDGGRVALAAISIKVPRHKAYRVMRIIGFTLSLVLAVVAVVFRKSLNFSYFTFLIFVLGSAVIPDKNSKYQRLYGMSFRMEKIRAGLTVKEIMIHGDIRLVACSRLLNANYYTKFIVTDDNMCIIGEVGEAQLEDFMARFSPSASISEVIGK